MNKKVVVIGAGIAGLTASIKLLEKGYHVILIEKNNDVGGLCSGYFVNGHYVDACLHWLMGTTPGSELYKMWKEIGAFSDDTTFVRLPTLGTVEYEGIKVTFYRDLDKAKEEWINISPEDKSSITKFFNSVRNMGKIMSVVLKARKVTRKEFLKTVISYPHIAKTMIQTREEYSKNFKHPALQFAIKNCQTGYNNMFFFLDLYGLFATDNADLPSGGAYYMVQRIKNRFLELGGELLLNTEVIELLTKNSNVFAVKTPEKEIKAGYFISTVDPQYTLNKLLNNKYQIKLFNKLDTNIDKYTTSSCFNVYIAVGGDTSKIDVPTGLNVKSIKVGASKADLILVRPYHYEPEYFIKDGKTVVSLFVDQDHNDYIYYKSLNKDEYQKEVNRIKDEMIDSFVKRYPEFKDKVELLSFFTPIDINNRFNTSYGSFQSFSLTGKGLFYSFKGKIKGLDNLFLCGQWCRSIGGTPTALLTGNQVVKYIK